MAGLFRPGRGITSVGQSSGQFGLQIQSRLCNLLMRLPNVGQIVDDCLFAVDFVAFFLLLRIWVPKSQGIDN